MSLRYLALGDSYTVGEAVPEAGRFPVQLAHQLREEGFAELEDPHVIATTGWTTDELSAGIDAASPAGAFDLVTLLIGVNNQYRGRSLDEYRAQFRELLERGISFAACKQDRVIVISIRFGSVSSACLSLKESLRAGARGAARRAVGHRGHGAAPWTDCGYAGQRWV